MEDKVIRSKFHSVHKGVAIFSGISLLVAMLSPFLKPKPKAPDSKPLINNVDSGSVSGTASEPQITAEEELENPSLKKQWAAELKLFAIEVGNNVIQLTRESLAELNKGDLLAPEEINMHVYRMLRYEVLMHQLQDLIWVCESDTEYLKLFRSKDITAAKEDLNDNAYAIIGLIERESTQPAQNRIKEVMPLHVLDYSVGYEFIGEGEPEFINQFKGSRKFFDGKPLTR